MHGYEYEPEVLCVDVTGYQATMDRWKATIAADQKGREIVQNAQQLIAVQQAAKPTERKGNI